MKTTKFLLSCFLLLSSLVGWSSTAWTSTTTTHKVKKWDVAFRTDEGMPVFDYVEKTEAVTTWGNLVVFNVETEGGASDHVVTTSRWNSWMTNNISPNIYFPKKWKFANIYLQYKPNVRICGDGKAAGGTDFSLYDSVSTNNTTEVKRYWFISFGKSNIYNND